MRPRFGNPAGIQNHNEIGIPNGAQPMCDHDSRGSQGGEILIHLGFRDGVQMTGGLIEN
jgi:hypothetical protein